VWQAAEKDTMGGDPDKEIQFSKRKSSPTAYLADVRRNAPLIVVANNMPIALTNRSII
jgi:hypothetical protein